METNAALVRPDGAVELNAESAVYMYHTVVVDPGYPEYNLTFRFDNPVEYAGLIELRIPFGYGFEGLKDFPYCLVKFLFARVTVDHCFIDPA